jgi:hypothetical protein
MSTDQVSIGGLVLDGFSAPQTMTGGGKHAMVVHKLPGGSRVIDTLGPDEADIPIAGQLYSESAYATCLALDAMRSSGQQVPLIWGGSFRTVIIADFHYTVHRFPNWCDYSILCLVVSNPSQGGLGGIVSSIGGLIAADLSAMGQF